MLRVKEEGRGRGRGVALGWDLEEDRDREVVVVVVVVRDRRAQIEKRATRAVEVRTENILMGFEVTGFVGLEVESLEA